MDIVYEWHALSANILGVAQRPQASVFGLILHYLQSCLAFRRILVETYFEGVYNFFDKLFHMLSFFNPVYVTQHNILLFALFLWRHVTPRKPTPWTSTLYFGGAPWVIGNYGSKPM